mgnify:CR=1 FL=1
MNNQPSSYPTLFFLLFGLFWFMLGLLMELFPDRIQSLALRQPSPKWLRFYTDFLRDHFIRTPSYLFSVRLMGVASLFLGIIGIWSFLLSITNH